ncbi:MAG: hypothetical protein ACFNUT_00290, partial [Bacteroidota bacterium]
MENKELIQVYVKSIYTSQNNNNYRVIELGETNGNRVMKVVLGMFEADFIAAALIAHAGWLSINVCTGALTVLALFAALG